MSPVNPFQRVREDNILYLKKLIAKAMPDGVLDSKLRAVMGMKCTIKRVNEYLQILVDSSQIEFDEEHQMWKLVINTE